MTDYECPSPDISFDYQMKPVNIPHRANSSSSLQFSTGTYVDAAVNQSLPNNKDTPSITPYDVTFIMEQVPPDNYGSVNYGITDIRKKSFAKSPQQHIILQSMEESTIVLPDTCVISGIVSTNNSSDECQNTTPVTLGTSTKESNAILKGEKNRLQHVNMGFAIPCRIAPPTSDILLWYTIFNRHHHAMLHEPEVTRQVLELPLPPFPTSALQWQQQQQQRQHSVISVDSWYNMVVMWDIEIDVHIAVVFFNPINPLLDFCEIFLDVLFINLSYLQIQVSFMDSTLEEILPGSHTKTHHGIFGDSLFQKVCLTLVSSQFAKKVFLNYRSVDSTLGEILLEAYFKIYFLLCDKGITKSPFCVPIVSSQFSISNLLQYFHIVAAIITTHFAKCHCCPVVLTDRDKPPFGKLCDHVLIPQVVFSVIAVSLPSRNSIPCFFLDDSSFSFSRQLEYGVQLYYEYLIGFLLHLPVDIFKYVEVDFSRVKESCLVFYHTIMDAIVSCVEEHIHNDALFFGFALKDEAGQYIAQYQVGKDTLPFIMTDDNEVFIGYDSMFALVGLSGEPLGESHLVTLEYAPRNIIINWYSVGEPLHISHAALCAIGDKHSQIEPPIREVFIQWIYQDNKGSETVLIDELLK